MARQKAQPAVFKSTASEEMVYIRELSGTERIFPLASLDSLRSLTGSGQMGTAVLFHESRSIREIRRLAQRFDSRRASASGEPELFSLAGGVSRMADSRQSSTARVSGALASVRAFSTNRLTDVGLSAGEALLLPGNWLQQWLETESNEKPGSLNEWLQDNEGEAASDRESALNRLLSEREEIRATVPMLDAAKIASLRGSRASEPRALAKRWRDSGELLGVKEGREFQYPEFQFDQSSGQLRPQMADILDCIRAGGDDADGWRAMHWFYARAGTLRGERPFEVFSAEPDRVVSAARMEFRGSVGDHQVSLATAHKTT